MKTDDDLNRRFITYMANLIYYNSINYDKTISGSMAFATGLVLIASFLGSPSSGVLSRFFRAPAVMEE